MDFPFKSRPWLFGLMSLLVALILLSTTGRSNVGASAMNPSADDVWFDVAETSIEPAGRLFEGPQIYRTVGFNRAAAEAILLGAPPALEATGEAPALLALPMPDGSYQQFEARSIPTMEPALAAKFPELTTYRVRGVDNPSIEGAVDLTPAGFHAMLFTDEGTLFIDPFQTNDDIHHYSYYEADYEFQGQMPFFHEPLDAGYTPETHAPESHVPSGTELRTYRLALAATGEYTQFHGGTVGSAMAEIVTSMNRVNGIYERDIAVRMVLVANNNLIIYTNGATDPYTNNSGGAMLGENQNNLDLVIGSANYDVGHVYSTGGGGIASLGVPCRGGLKARGVTGLNSPVGDPFYVDYVAHEIGHQFGANHTFNGNAGSCAGGNRNGSTAYEPGSGTTIMAYAGICSSQNTQSNSDDHFHGASYDEMVAYTTTSFGNSCPVITATGNTPPTVDAGVTGLSIPINTPFSLTGSANDVDGDTMSYNWEQFDLGPAGHPNSPVNNAPIFRSFPSKTEPTRTFPQISDIVNNTQTIGEILPSYSRDLTFRLTVRDNRADGGGVDFDTVSFDVVDSAGPFVVTWPAGGDSWFIGGLGSVTWDVANTDVAPVSCANVDIDLSTDGGFTYTMSLASDTPNDGSATITVPHFATTTARVRVSCADNIFFNISNADFSIISLVDTLLLPFSLVDN